MSRYLTMSMITIASLYSAVSFGATGETWDVTTRGSGIPETVMTVCYPPGVTKDPKQFMQREIDCEVSDVKTSGKKMTWKMQCGHGDERMTGKGEATYSSTSYQGTTEITGKSAGEPVTMKITYLGKRIGAECDTDSKPVVKGMENLDGIMGMAKSQMESAMAEQCEVANHGAAELISNRFFGPKAACTGKEKSACKVIAKSVAKDPATFAKLMKYEESSDLGIVKTCNIDLTAAKKSICPKVNSNNYEDLADACPEEAKAFAVENRKSTEKTGQGNPEEPGIFDKAMKLKGMLGF